MNPTLPTTSTIVHSWGEQKPPFERANTISTVEKGMGPTRETAVASVEPLPVPFERNDTISYIEYGIFDESDLKKFGWWMAFCLGMLGAVAMWKFVFLPLF